MVHDGDNGLFLPLSDAVPLQSAYFGAGNESSLIFLDNLDCTGYELSLLSCHTTTKIGEHNCDHSEDAAVQCEGITP